MVCRQHGRVCDERKGRQEGQREMVGEKREKKERREGKKEERREEGKRNRRKGSK